MDRNYLDVLKAALVESLDFIHEFGVERKVEERIWKKDLLLAIMRGAVREMDGEEEVASEDECVSSDDEGEEAEEVKVVPIRRLVERRDSESWVENSKQLKAVKKESKI